jgi:radical SAM superfamily enzyme YgiQ (UPF0313 family)
MKIFCVYLCDFKDRGDYYLSLMPYGITSIAAFLEKEGHEVTLANFSSYGFSKGAELTITGKPDAVAVSIFSFNRTESFKYIKELKKRNKNIIIIAGGQHPTFLSGQIHSRFPEINFIIKGEGELSIKKLIDDSFLHNEPVINSERITDINSIPYGSLFSGEMIGVNPAEQFRFIITSRGCPSGCTYCSSPYFWKKKVTYRSPQNIIDELKHIQKKYGIIYFSIRDDNFTLNKKRVIEFCRLLGESGLYMMWNCQARVDTIDEEMLVAMKMCGLEHIQYGVESGSEKILKVYDKQITLDKIKKAAAITRKAGVYLSFYLMAGMTGETMEDLEDTKKLIKCTMPHDVIVSPVAYYPGTGIYAESIKKGKINDSIWFESEENGLYLGNTQKNKTDIQMLLSYSEKITSKAVYGIKDFNIHIQTTGGKCWMNHIIEGDYYTDQSEIKKASQIYDKLITEFPKNIWGYLKKAELICEQSPAQAIKLFDKALKIVPEYYGAWFRKAQIQFSINNITEAKQSAEKAAELNPYDPEITGFAEQIKKK